MRSRIVGRHVLCKEGSFGRVGVVTEEVPATSRCRLWGEDLRDEVRVLAVALARMPAQREHVAVRKSEEGRVPAATCVPRIFFLSYPRIHLCRRLPSVPRR